jgi:hypothetical protein
MVSKLLFLLLIHVYIGCCFRICKFHSRLFTLSSLLSPEEEASLKELLSRTNQARRKTAVTRSNNNSNVEKSVKTNNHGNVENLKEENIRNEKRAPIVSPKPLEFKPIYAPNKEWRNANTNPYRPKIENIPNSFFRNSRSNEEEEDDDDDEEEYEDDDDDEEEDYEDTLEFNYEDIEQAMRELESPYMGRGLGMRGKYYEEPEIDENSILIGETLNETIWKSLQQLDGNFTSYPAIHREQSDVILLVADPRRFNQRFVKFMEEIDRLPKKMSLAKVAVVSDDAIEVKKYLKKRTLNMPILLDQKGKVSGSTSHQS